MPPVICEISSFGQHREIPWLLLLRLLRLLRLLLGLFLVLLLLCFFRVSGTSMAVEHR